MFAKFVSATWGEETGAEAEDEGQAKEAPEQHLGETKHPHDLQGKDPIGPSFSLWGVATSLADSVKKNTAEITTGIKETNWRAELEAFSKGVREEEHQLRKETAKRVEVAKEHLPKDATAQLDLKRKELTAHLQKMGVGLGGLGKTLVTRTTDLFDQVRDTVVEELSDKGKGKMQRQGSRSLSKGKYSRLDADISSMQRDSATYCDEPADTADYQAWRSTFDLASFKPAVQELIRDNAFMAELQARIVPVIVEYDAFWTRYFYRLHLLQARHAQRLELARRASRPQQEEELGWDDADADEQPQEPQKPSAPASPLDSTKFPVQDEAAPAAPLTNPQAVLGLDSPANADITETDAETLSMQAKAEEHEAKIYSGGSQEAKQDEGGAKARDARAVIAGKEAQKASSIAGDEDTADIVTSSESGSGNEHWTVVTSPSKQSGTANPSAFTAATASTSSPSSAAPAAGTEDQSKPSVALSGAESGNIAAVDSDESSEIDELDDVSNDADLDATGGARSEGDEDWGAWE